LSPCSLAACLLVFAFLLTRALYVELWVHPHTHTSLFPKSGKHVMAALAYFEQLEKTGSLVPSASQGACLAAGAADDVMRRNADDARRTDESTDAPYPSEPTTAPLLSVASPGPAQVRSAQGRQSRSRTPGPERRGTASGPRPISSTGVSAAPAVRPPLCAD
jgi:hypothetical protein